MHHSRIMHLSDAFFRRTLTARFCGFCRFVGRCRLGLQFFADGSAWPAQKNEIGCAFHRRAEVSSPGEHGARGTEEVARETRSIFRTFSGQPPPSPSVAASSCDRLRSPAGSKGGSPILAGQKSERPRNSALTRDGKFHILAASRIYPRGWGRIWGVAHGEISADHEAIDRGMEAGGALRTY
jgi:hypothetical protein